MIDAKHIFGFHKATDKTLPQHTQVRKMFIGLAKELDELLPDGREKSLAMTTLQEAAMWSNASVAMQAPLVKE